MAGTAPPPAVFSREVCHIEEFPDRSGTLHTGKDMQETNWEAIYFNWEAK